MESYTLEGLNSMTLDERKIALSGDFGSSFHGSAAEHVTWIFWTRDTTGPTDILGQGSAFLLDRGQGPILVTAGHVYKQYVEDADRFGPLYCMVANVRVRDLRKHLIAWGDLEEGRADIATFRLPPDIAEAIGKKPVQARGTWPPPPNPGEQIMFVGFPGNALIFAGPSELNFGSHSGMQGLTVITDHQITMRFDRNYWLTYGGDAPPLGYGLGGISGGPLLVPDYRDGVWDWRLGGVISQATEEREPGDVLFEMVVAHRAEYIQPDGTLALRL